jgi:LPS-assembly lipoprotein
MRVFALLTFLILTACGFTPVYNTHSVSSSLNQIEIAAIPNREGQIVRNHLIDRMYVDGYPANPQYQLSVSPIIETIVKIGIDKDDEASRAQLRQQASFRLIDINTQEIVLERTVRTISGYNILAGQFKTFVTEQDAREQALKALAEDIVTQLQLHF